MINLCELEQFVLFAETGSLSEVAERIHISAPTLSRSMQNVEATFGVPLFNRTKNRLTLNATGLKAVEYSKTLLSTASDTLMKVREYDKSLQTIVVKSCAPAPLWKLLPTLNMLYPSMTIATSICDINELDAAISENSYDILILPYMTKALSEDSQFFLMDEHLSICVRKDHELVSNSSLPSFITDVAIDRYPIPQNRIAIPISDADANVSFYIAIKNTSKYKGLLSKLKQ